MKEARDLLKCERCAVFLVDLECCEAVREIFLWKITQIIINKFSTHSHAHQSHLERMLMSVNQIDYEESNKPENDASKKVTTWVSMDTFRPSSGTKKDDNDLTIFFPFHYIFIESDTKPTPKKKFDGWKNKLEGHLCSTQIYPNIWNGNWINFFYLMLLF
jgi:hypothetical protein